MQELPSGATGSKISEHRFDVVVVGGGGSGLAAAIEARSLGRDVVLLEKNAEIGGSTVRSIGSISATATPHQLREGIKDSPQEHFEDLGKFNATVKAEDNLALRRLLVDNVGDTFRWLLDMGVGFFGPTPEPPHRKPRMHNVLPNSRAYGYHLERQARASGVVVRTRRRASRLLTQGDAVVGVECEGPDGEIEYYYAAGGVVLASGDYSASAELKLRFGSEAASRVGPINPANTGDGHAMAMELGGRVINRHLQLALVRFVAPPRRRWIELLPPWRIVTKFMELSLAHMPSWLLRPFIMSFLTTILATSPALFASGAILVNKRGERFADELDRPVFRLAQQEDQLGYLILDGKLADKFSAFPHFLSTAPGIAYAYIPDYRRSRKDIFNSAVTIEALAEKIGADPAVLRATIERRNAEVKASGNTGFMPLDTGPYVALGPVRSYVNLTDGGLAIDGRLRVLDAQDRPIPGLYAAGSAGQGGMLLEGHGHHLGWAFTSGRLAGRAAAYQATSADL